MKRIEINMAPRKAKPQITYSENLQVGNKEDRNFIYYIKFFITHNPFLTVIIIWLIIGTFSSCDGSSSKKVKELEYKIETLKNRVEKLEKNESSSDAKSDTW